MATRKLEHEKPTRSDHEIGRYGLPFSEDYSDGTRRLLQPRSKVSVQQLMTMRRTDGQARSLNRLLTQPILAALETATFTRPKGGGARETAFVEAALTAPFRSGGMRVPFRKFVAQVLLALNDGFAPFEIVPYSPKTGDFKNKWTFEKLAYRPSNTISFLLDQNDNFAGLNQKVVNGAEYLDVNIPSEYSFYYAAQEEEAPFYGRSYFEAAYEHYDKKVKLYYLMHLAAQRAAVGQRVGTHPKGIGKQEKLQFRQALEDMRAAGYAAVPEGFTIEGLREVTGWDFLAAINHHNTQMSKSVLAQFNDDQQGSGGDASLIDFGQQSDKMFITMLKSIMADIQDIVNNELVTRLVDWNFGSGKYPTWQFGQITDEQAADVMDTFNKLATAGQSFVGTPEFLRELEIKRAKILGLDINYKEVAKREEEQAKLQEQQMLAQQQLSAPTESGTPAEASTTIDVPQEVLPEGFQLSRIVKTQQGAQYFGVPIGGVISTDQQQPGQSSQPATPQQESVEIKEEMSHPDAKGATLLVFADGTVAIRDANGNIGKRQKIDLVKFKELGWKIERVKLDVEPVTAEEARKQQLGTSDKKSE